MHLGIYPNVRWTSASVVAGNIRTTPFLLMIMSFHTYTITHGDDSLRFCQDLDATAVVACSMYLRICNSALARDLIRWLGQSHYRETLSGGSCQKSAGSQPMAAQIYAQHLYALELQDVVPFLNSPTSYASTNPHAL